MAAAALSIGLPIVFPFVAKLMDKIFGDKTGDVKKSTGLQILSAIMPALQKIVGPSISLPTKPEEIAVLLQSTVDDLNSKGELKGVATKIDVTPAGAAPGLNQGATMMLQGAMLMLQGK